MNALIFATVIGTALLVIPLAVVVHGIHRQERAGLDSHDAGLCATFTRRLIGLSGTGEPAIRRAAASGREPSSKAARRNASQRAVLATGARS